jgi:hypothetical protein
MGRYILKRDNLCHSPSNAIIVPLQFGLSAITNSAKKTIAKIKQIKDKIPSNPLDTLKKYNPTNNGASVKSRKPITEP